MITACNIVTVAFERSALLYASPGKNDRLAAGAYDLGLL